MWSDAQIAAMFAGYVDAAFWISNGDGGLEGAYGVTDLAPEVAARMLADCKAFVAADLDDAQAYISDDRFDAAHFGHDLWLTRNRHGVGFWNRDLGLLGERLTMRANALGEDILYVGDDGKVYASCG